MFKLWVNCESKHVVSFTTLEPTHKDKNGSSVLNIFIVMQSYIIFNYKSKSPHCKGGCARNLWLNSPFNLILMQMATCSASNKSKYVWVWFKTRCFTTCVNFCDSASNCPCHSIWHLSLQMNRLFFIANVYNFQSSLEEDNFACKSNFTRVLSFHVGSPTSMHCLIPLFYLCWTL
jgi:hypothetical protein